MRTFVCFNDEDDKYQKIQFHVYAALMSFSAFFLGVTFLVYIFLPKLLNLHGKTVVCHVIAMFVGYSFLSIIQFSTEVRPPFCMCIGKKRETHVKQEKSNPVTRKFNFRPLLLFYSHVAFIVYFGLFSGTLFIP
jgi:hypothetical protein